MKPEVLSEFLGKPSLVVDGSSASVFVGLLDGSGEWLSQVYQRESAALEGLFPSVEAVLRTAQYRISEVHNFIYCEGPGSVLGLRLCAMALCTWGCLSELTVRYLSYNSLQLCSALIAVESSGASDALLISDWKKDAWNSVLIRKGQSGAISVVDDRYVNEWSGGPLFYLPQRKGWQKIPEGAVTLEYSPHRLTEVMHLLKKTEKIELYAANMNVFQKWVPKRHA